MLKKNLFLFFFFLGIISISILFLPALILPSNIILFGGKLMGHWSGICLRIFLSTKIIIKGKENMIKNEKFFIASSHQSMFETFYLQTIFNSPVFILKNELIKITDTCGFYDKHTGIQWDWDKVGDDSFDWYKEDQDDESVSEMFNRFQNNHKFD